MVTRGIAAAKLPDPPGWNPQMDLLIAGEYETYVAMTRAKKKVMISAYGAAFEYLR